MTGNFFCKCGLCPAGSYCPTSTYELPCPTGFFCQEGIAAPRSCTSLVACSEGLDRVSPAALFLLLVGWICAFIVAAAVQQRAESRKRKRNQDLQHLIAKHCLLLRKFVRRWKAKRALGMRAGSAAEEGHVDAMVRGLNMLCAFRVNSTLSGPLDAARTPCPFSCSCITVRAWATPGRRRIGW